MKRLLCAFTVAAALTPWSASAQVKIDMGRVTCGEFLAMPADNARDFSAWMSGWFNQKNGRSTIDMGAFQQNIANVKDWCASHKSDSVMGGLQRAVDKKNSQ